METAIQDMIKQGNQGGQGNQTKEGNQSNQGNQGNQGMNKRKEQSKEGKVAREIETQTAKVPSDVFLWTSLAVMATSLTFKILKKDNLALFIGQWAAPILVTGLYNKVVKTTGHDMTDPA
jgi:hypothetical protein